MKCERRVAPYYSSREESVTNYKDKEPCKMCGSYENDHFIMTCFNCRVAREHIYCCTTVHFKTVPDMWICEECCALIRVLFIKHGVAKGPNETANTRRINRAYNQVPVASRTRCVDGQKIGSEHSGNEDSAAAGRQQPDTNTPSDSESAK